MIAQSHDVPSSLYSARIQVQKRLSGLCPSTDDEALSVFFRHGDKRHSHRACNKTTERGKRKMPIRVTRAAFLTADHMSFSLRLVLMPLLSQKHLDCLYGSRQILNIDFKLYRGLGTFIEIYKCTGKSYVFCFYFSSSSSSRRNLCSQNLLTSSLTMKRDDCQHNAEIICYIAPQSLYLEIILLTPHLHKRSFVLIACLLKLV